MAAIVNYERARTAFMPIMIADSDAVQGEQDDYEFWLKLLPEGQRELTEETEPALMFAVDHLSPTDVVPVGWIIVPNEADAAELAVARHYQIGGRRISTNEPFPTATVKIKEI